MLRILKALVVSALALAIAVACGIGFVTELGRMAWWEYVAYPGVMLLAVAAAIGVWMRDAEPRSDAHTAEVDGVRMTVYDAALVQALDRASKEPGGDVVIGIDPTSGQVSYRVVKR